MKGEQPYSCPYCGWPVREPGPCVRCRPLYRVDPLGSALRGRLSERDLGMVGGWPIEEAIDDGREE